MKKIPLILNKLIYFKEEKIGFVCVAVNGRSDFIQVLLRNIYVIETRLTEKDDF